MKRVLVIGGGFAGVEAAIELQKKKMFDVTLVSDRDFMYIYPISIWVPVGLKKFDDVKIPLSDIQKANGFHVVLDRVVKIESENSRVVCEKESIEYDYLVVAIGADKMHLQGIENTLSICGEPTMAPKIQDRLEAIVEKGSGTIAMGFGGNPKDKSSVRGGPGFELLFNIHTMLKKRGVRNNFKLVFFAPMDKPGARMGERSLTMMDKMFNSLNIERYLGKKIKNFSPDGVVFEDDSKLEADFTMFIPASKGHSVFANSNLPLSDAGFVKIDDSGLVEGSENVYVAGDAAAIEGPEWKAKQGHLAEVMARNIAYNIEMTEKGDPRRKGYQEHLNILCVMDNGDGAAFIYRDSKRSLMIPLPIVGHWLKIAWGYYAKWTKTGKFPRFPWL